MEKNGDNQGNPTGNFDQGHAPLPEQFNYQQQQGFFQPIGQPQQPAFGPPTQVHVITQQPASYVGVVGFDDNMTEAILSCLCCFWPLGLVAILKSCEARSAYDRGDIAMARNQASQARNLALVSFIIGVIIIVIVFIVGFTVFRR